jgi:hypothetical protein
MAGSVCKLGTPIWRAKNGGGHREKLVLQKTSQTNYFFFVRKL